MNFAPFSGQFQSAAAAAMPTIHQFAAKFGYEGGGQERYPVQLVDGVKFRPDGLVVVSAAQPVGLANIAPSHSAVNTGVKYQTISSSVNMGNIAYAGGYGQEQPRERDKRACRDDHELMAMMHQHQVTQSAPLQQGAQQLLVVLHEPKEAAALARAIKQEARPERTAAMPSEFISIGDVSDSSTWQTLGNGVADYLSSLPLPLHHLLKYSANGVEKREEPAAATVAPTLPSINTLTIQPTVNSVVVQTTTIVNPNISAGDRVLVASAPRPKKKKKVAKEKKQRPKPGEIRLTTALDGSTLYCCPECHMAYPERGLLEQHLLGHTMERRYICDICNAALKRKDHLTRHKQSHNPERPHACSVCLKAFKRKEQLTLHFVIHSGEKRHVCNECGKGFYRKDHLRKHSRSHIARRVKAELSQQGAPPPAPAPS